MHPIIEDLQWRYATKQYDPTKRVSTAELEIIKESLRLTATSYGVQPLKFLIVESPELRAKLKVASFGQSQLTDASHVIILCSYIDVNHEDIDAYMTNISTTRSIPHQDVVGFGEYIKEVITPMTTEDISIWTSKQAYIALGQVMHTCATLRIDSTPMEGFDSLAYDEILGLSAQNLNATLVFAIGYRHEDDAAQYHAKVRQSSEDMFAVI
jgi:nitroreductase